MHVHGMYQKRYSDKIFEAVRIDSHGVFFSFAVLVLVFSFQICLADCDALLARIEALEIQGQQQQNLLQLQNERLLQQEETISTLLEWKQRHDLSSRTPPVDGGQVSRDQSETGIKKDDDVKDTKKQINGLGSEESIVRKGIVRPSRIVLGETGSVAFQAVIAKGDSPPLGQHQKIVFDHVTLNLGNGYRSQHGLFIAPAPGLYMFSYSVVSHNNDNLQTALMKNGVIIAGAFAESTNGRYNQGSVSVVTQLVAGDEIWVEERYDDHSVVHGNYQSSFMGILVTPL